MKPYLISLDLDDTILSKHKEIPFLTRIGLKHLVRKGHKIILNSGRPLQAILPYVKKLKLYNQPFVCSNGSCIYWIDKKGNIIKTHPYNMDKQLLNEFFTLLKPHLQFAYFQCERIRYYYKYENVLDFMKQDWKGMPHQIIDEFRFKEDVFFSAFTICESGKEIMDQWCAKEEHKVFSFLDWEHSDQYYPFDMQALSCNKGRAMLDLATEYHIEINHVLAFGDERNDIPMLMQAGRGYLMPKAKQIAKETHLPLIDFSSDKNGVLRYLYKHYRDMF